MIPDAQLEYKYGGQKPNIESNFFPPDMTIRGKTPMTMTEVKNELPDAVKYVAPWGLMKAMEQEELARKKREEEERAEALRLENERNGLNGIDEKDEPTEQELLALSKLKE